MMPVPELILASGSATRQKLLRDAGITHSVVPADVDEAAIRAGLQKSEIGIGYDRVAEALAEAKAESVSRAHPGALVIGSDQVLAFGREAVSKPRNLAAAREALQMLRGREHRLHSAVALATDGKVVWRALETAVMIMRNFSDEFLDGYLDSGGADLCHSAGAYQIEARGIQLFDRIEGSHQAILGMPLLPLLAELRRRRVIPA